MKKDIIAVIDAGRIDNSILARQIRTLNVYSEIFYDFESLPLNSKKFNLKGIIINGTSAHIDIPQTTLSLSHRIPIANREEIDSIEDLSFFLFDKAKCNRLWTISAFIQEQIAEIQNKVTKNDKVILALSGGVDSSVVAALLLKALLPSQIYCVHVNNGLLRKNESENVLKVFGKYLGDNLVYVDATQRFLEKLKGVSDPEKKRKIIGEEFIRIFEEESNKLHNASFLAQGTIYSDVVESGGKSGKSVKAHHNVGGLPNNIDFSLIEPLKTLFKDEVRACGKELGLPDNMVFRQPFPGPGLGIRCLGKITKERLEALRESDYILLEEFKRHELSDKVWQYFTLIPDILSVGVRNGARDIGYTAIIRAVNTLDGMTASIEHIDWKILDLITHRITNEIPSINRVCYDLTPKPTGTIEWE